jgi:Integrase core domain
MPSHGSTAWSSPPACPVAKPGHPRTQGKVERFQQAMKNWLRAQPRQPANLAELQVLLDDFAAVCNTRRPHRSLEGRATPATAYAARPRAVPGDRAADTHDWVRTDRVDATGLVTLRHSGRLYHIGIGRPHAGTRVLLLIQDQRNHRDPYAGSRCPRCLATSQWWQVFHIGTVGHRLGRSWYDDQARLVVSYLCLSPAGFPEPCARVWRRIARKVLLRGVGGQPLGGCTRCTRPPGLSSTSQPSVPS